MITIDGQSVAVEKHVPFIKEEKKDHTILYILFKNKRNEYLNYDDLDGAHEFFIKLN